VLDVGCGPGGWALDVAQAYPGIQVEGIDISQRMVDYAREQAAARQVADRVHFHVMDALRMLEFPNAFFDLVNLRFAISFMRTWDWQKLLGEFRRVTASGGIVRLTDNNIVHESNSPALTRLQEIGVHTLFRSGNLFSEDGAGLIAHLPRLLEQHGWRDVQTRAYVLQFHAGTPEGQAYYEDMAHVFQTTLPFIRKWGCAPADYDTNYQQALQEMQQSDFHVSWHYLTAWGQRGR
jgi:ubiquinone/menaquinone biosynthesis C-methylase UbiE